MMPAFTLNQSMTNSLLVHHYRPSPATIVIVARGDVDAFDADDLVTTVRNALGSCESLVLDFTAVGFFSTQGLRALDVLVAAGASCPRTALVPSPAVARLIQLCPTAPAIALAADVDEALDMVGDGVRVTA